MAKGTKQRILDDALVLRRKSEGAWRRACLVAGILLLCWTITEMVIIPNSLSAFYLILGILQTATAIALVRGETASQAPEN